MRIPHRHEIIGDPHFKSDNGNETTMMTNEICSIIQKENPYFIIVLGDILHRHEKIDLFPYHRAESFLKAIHTSKSIGSKYKTSEVS